MGISQFFAISIFLCMFVCIVSEKIERHIVTLVSGALVLILVFGICMHSWDAIVRTLNLNCLGTLGFWYGEEERSSGINWATIIFIAGMTVMVEGMGLAGFFDWLCLKLAKMVKYKVVPLFICFMLISGLLAMFIDSITVIMFLAAVTIELSKTLKFDPVPMVLSEIFCANLGGSATMCGDPPNIIVGTALGYSFFDFIENTGFVVLICFAFIIPYYYLVMRKSLKESQKNLPADIVYPNPEDAITNKRGFILSAVVFGITVVLLVTHAQTGLSVATIGVISTVITLLFTAIAFGKEKIIELLKRVDYKTLLFFIGLFVVVSGLEETGILEVIASLISKLSGGNLLIIIAILLWVSAIASAFVDNIPFAATMIPVIISMSETAKVPLSTLAWTLSLGTDIGGCATPIGASANVVGLSLVAKSGHPVNWGRYCKYNAPATILAVAVSMVCLYMRYGNI